MAETLVEKKSVKLTPKERLEKLLRERSIKVFTAEDFEIPTDDETQAKIRAEVDEFLQMLEDQREINKKFSAERDKLWQ